ncbi:hypothetical protein MN0502_17380 [Arthrobacter sp. MN05-02]|nr:hypothetical protein MN0502_17380 [Arthrobacter sp. MN05-02]
MRRGEQGIEGRRSQLRRDGLERLDGHQGDRGVHVRGLAEEAVTDDALALHHVHAGGVDGGDIGGAVPRPSEVGMRPGHEQVQDLHVVPELRGHTSTLSGARVHPVRTGSRLRLPPPGQASPGNGSRSPCTAQ